MWRALVPEAEGAVGGAAVRKEEAVNNVLDGPPCADTGSVGARFRRRRRGRRAGLCRRAASGEGGGGAGEQRGGVLPRTHARFRPGGVREDRGGGALPHAHELRPPEAHCDGQKERGCAERGGASDDPQAHASSRVAAGTWRGGALAARGARRWRSAACCCRGRSRCTRRRARAPASSRCCPR